VSQVVLTASAVVVQSQVPQVERVTDGQAAVLFPNQHRVLALGFEAGAVHIDPRGVHPGQRFGGLPLLIPGGAPLIHGPLSLLAFPAAHGFLNTPAGTIAVYPSAQRTRTFAGRVPAFGNVSTWQSVPRLLSSPLPIFGP